jgi:hypothetical protein
MTKDEFMEMYYSHSIEELTQMFNCTTTTLYRTLKRYDIPLKKQKFKLGGRAQKIVLE